MSVAVICIVIAGIMVPGIVLEANQKSEHDHVAKVPKSYLPSGSVMAKEASVNHEIVREALSHRRAVGQHDR